MLTSLYRYQTLSAYSLASLVNNTVWLATPSTFNDPFDCAVTLDRKKFRESLDHAITRVVQQARPEDLAGKDLSGVRPGDAEAYDEYRNGIRTLLQDMGVLCLSEVPDSMLMWSHYAGHHLGFCVEYDFGEDTQLKKIAHAVQYSDNIPSFSAADLAGPGKSEALDALWLTKAECWAYEKEWRVMMPKGGKPYQAPSAVRAVIFGARMPDRRVGAASEADLARPEIFVHHPIAHEAVQRALERGRLVFLEHEVADPREAVAAQQRQ